MHRGTAREDRPPESNGFMKAFAGRGSGISRAEEHLRHRTNSFGVFTCYAVRRPRLGLTSELEASVKSLNKGEVLTLFGTI